MEIDEVGSESGQEKDISTTAQKIVSEIKSLEKELESIQESCTHPSSSIKNSASNGESSFCLRRICDTCQAVVGYPSTEEINKWVGS